MQGSVDDGGLGFKDVFQHNRVFLMKIGYQLVSMPDVLWVRVLRAKYKVEDIVPLRDLLPLEVLECIATTPTLTEQYSADVPGWRWNERRNFKVSSVYSVLMELVESLWNTKWRGIWSLRVPQHIRVFMWLTALRRHLTNVERVQRHLALLEECSLCQVGLEVIDHVLRFCERARDFWTSVIPPGETARFFTLPFEEWLHANFHSSGLGWVIVRIGVADKLDALGRAQSMAGGDLCHATIVADEKRCWEDHSRAAILPFQCCRRTDPGG
ncbi:hypothetical protein V6N12_062557 [Hibiscus sabdariffa]|uniref:Reverse transcriptase zinc-binding domain-containing protein n=1 Tax=Hibiscus sabdariffa TaxID=183260 RepID=A0ABR2F973_9ROSI